MEKFLKSILAIIFFVCFGNLNGQIEFSKWYFGQYAGLNFSTPVPSVLTNGALYNTGGSATICDNTGNLLFYTDGTGIWNSTHTPMANGTGLLGTSSTQSGIIVKQPGNPNLYYVFTVPGTGDQNTPTAYNIVDMTLAAGLGSVTVKNYSLYYSTTEKQVAVRHCNGKDVWVVSHEFYTNNFRAYLLTSSGLNLTPVISAAGETVTLPGASAAGELKISQDGRKLAMATSSNSSPPATQKGGFFLFDFDAATGVVSNPLALLSATNSFGRPSGVEFSPDGTKLYGTSHNTGSQVTSGLHQWDVCAATPTAIVNSLYTYSVTGPVFGSVQHAVNGKLYIGCLGQQSLTVINNPNAAGTSMNLVLYGQSIAPKFSTKYLPNYINSYLRPVASPFTNTVNCQNVLFSVPSSPTFSSGCQATPYPASGYQWDFGDATSGAANTSSLTSPSHLYSALGTYSVSLILYNPCSNDTLKKTITISTPGPTTAITGNTLFCKGDKRILTASGGSVYAWSTGANTTTISITPTQTSVYTCSATLNGCTLSKAFTVTVNPCLGISTNESTSMRLFPNPVIGALTIDLENAAELSIYDLNGKLVVNTQLLRGENVVHLHELPSAVYVVDVNGVRYRIVKMANE